MFKKSTTKCVTVYSLFYNLLLIKFIVFEFSISEVAAITEQQRLEVQRLKSELAEALESDNENVGAKGAIVQPAWTQGDNKPDPKETVKVEDNAKIRDEVAALRAEIGQAVVKDKFVTSGTAKSQDIKALTDSFSLKEKGREALLAMTGQQNDPLALEQEQVGAGTDSNEDEGTNFKAPNVIAASIADDAEIDMRKLQRLEVAKRRVREVLILKYIEEDFSFDFGPEVHEWKYIVHAGQEYFVGRRITDLLVVRKDTAKYEKAMVVDVGHVINYIETYNYWNLDQQQQEGIILIATGDKVLWYRTNNETKQIELYWDWIVGNTITGLTYFSLDSKDYITISSNQSSLAGHYALNLYQYKLSTKEFWIAQRLQLKFPCEEVTVLNTGRDVILAIPQNDTAAIFTFNPHEAEFSHIRFQLKRSVTAVGILTIAGFKMGGRSYLALTGFQPQILLYQHGDFISKTILGNNFGLVELFFPIPVRTYRDDLILLVQHRVDFSTHTLTVVETLIWDGEAFETSIPVPCHMGEHVVFGVACMLDLQRDEGLKGAALLKSGDDISVIVPRYKAESGLFRFHTELLAKNSELLDLQEIFEFLKDWVKEQDDLVAQAEAFLKIPNEQLVDTKPDLTNLESLKTPEFVFNGNIGEMYVNDYKWTPEDSKIDLEFIIQNMEDFEKSLNSGRQRRNLNNVLHEELEFDEVIVEDLELDNLNGETFFIQNGDLNFEGVINFSQLEVFEKLIDLQKRQVNDDEDFIVNGDLEFDIINNVAWRDIKDNLVFKNQKQNFGELEVEGQIIVENSLSINTLNTLDFPNDYMLSNGPRTSTVVAEKHFANTLSASSVDTNGLINGKNPLNAITLMDPQAWQAMPTFKQLEVAEILELHGQVHGRNVESFPQNPTLQETNVVEAACHFNELFVNGPIVLKGEIDKQALGTLLKNVLIKPQDPNEEIVVPSSKSFGLVTFPIDFQLENNTINQIPVSDFVTINTNQTLAVRSLEGYVYFYNLTLNGSYDGVRIEDVLKEIILLENPLDLSTTELIFPGDLKAKSVKILDSLNKQPLKDNLQTLQEDLIVKSAEFESLDSQQTDFSQDILGQGKLNNIELHSIVNGSSADESPTSGNIFLNELILGQGIQTDELHGIKAEFLLEFLTQVDELPQMVLNGQIEVDGINVTGDVQLNEINDLNFDEQIKLNTIKLNQPNILSTKLTFKNHSSIKGDLNIMGNFNGDFLPDIIDDIVIRSYNACIDIKASKSFLKPINVLQNTQVKTLNGIPMENVAWKNKELNFKGSMQLKGNLVVRNINVKGNINNLNWQDLHNLVYFNETLQYFVLKNITEFKNSLLLEDLTVLGDLNDVTNLSDFFENLIFKNHVCLLKGKNTFTGRVSIDNGAYIRNLNGHDLMHFFNNLVFVHGPQAIVIESPVQFEDFVQANDVQVKNFLEIQNLNGCSLKEWLNNSLRVDQDQYIPHFLNFAAGSLDGNSLSVNYLNDLDLSRVITLNTAQTFNETVKFSDVILNGFISTKGRVNNLNIEKEFNNTLMTYGNQHVTTPLTIQSIEVLGDLTVRGLVNKNKNLTDVATLGEDLILESPLYIQSIYTPQVIMNDLVTGIDFNKWFTSAVKYQQSSTQYITGNWSIKNLTVTNGPKDFQYMINGYEPWQYYSYIRSPRNDDQDDIQDKEICQLIKEIWRDIGNKSVYIKYIEEEFNMNLDKELETHKESPNKIFYLKSHQQHFLLVNLKCQSFIYKWLAAENKFNFEMSYKSGPIEQIEVIPFFSKSNELQFITNSANTDNTNCSLSPVNKWKLQNDSIVLESKLPQSSDVAYRFQGNDSSIWTLDNNTIKELNLDNEIKRKWQLPVAENCTRYRFVPLKEQQEILLTNGQHLVLLNNHLGKNLNKSALALEEATFFRTSFLENLKENNSESLLKPNISLTRAFVFADFKQVIERILIDLGQRLNQQVNVTQLSIPESDLFDEHLVPDFLAIIKELKKQKIYPTVEFNISFDHILVPKNPAQVLAARVVQISWPVVVEIEEIHSYIKTNESHNHPLCSSITKSLGILIKDVLMLANKQNRSKDYTLDLTNVIERIRTFEKDLEEYLKALEKHQDVKPVVKNLEKDLLPESSTKREFSVFSHVQDDLMFVENSHLPGYKQGEILPLQVGGNTKPLHLWAVTYTKTSLIANNNPGIYLYVKAFKRQLYQVISAVKPRSLQHIRIKQETFLLYIQDCCQVQILRYRGSQGFKKFADIFSKEYIKQILTVAVPSQDGSLKHFLLLLTENNVKFYEFVIEGWNFTVLPAIPQIFLDCL